MIERRKRRVHLFNIIAFHLFIELFILLVAKIVEADQVEYDLIHSILKDYDPSIRPSVHHNYTLNVTFGLSLTQLIDIDERNMIVTTNCWLTQNWIDPKLQWNLNKFNNIQSVHIPAERIWKPDILLVNNADSWAKTSSISTNAIVKHDGNVTWLSTVIFKSSCSINVRYFPFDEQQCDMIFASWTFDGYLLDIDVNSNEGDLTNYIKNGEWHLVRLIATKNLKKYSCCEEPYPEIYYRLVIRRRPLFYVFNMVFPCLLITLVAFLGFYLPPGSTEKVSIGITTLLSITVFLMLVAESMPPTSEQLPLLGIYYAVTIGIVSFSTAMAVVTLNIANNGNKGRSVPRLIKVIFFNYLSRIMCIELTSKAKRREEYKSQFYKQELTQMNHTRKATSTITTPASINDPFKWMSNHLESPLLSSSSSGNRSFKSNRHIRRNNSSRQRNNHQTEVFIELNDAMTTNESPFYMTATGSGKKSNKLILKSADDDETETILSEPTRRRRNRSSLIGKGENNGSGLVSEELASDFERVLDKQFRPLVDALLNTINTNERRLNDKRTMELIQAEWSDVAMISDHILCYFFCALTLACCFLIFFNSPHALAEW